MQTSPDSAAAPRLGLVTGATGYVGSNVVERLLTEGWRVRIVSRKRDKAESMAWGSAVVPEGQSARPGEVEVVEGDADDADVMRTAMADVDVAWFLLHSMGDEDDFAQEEAQLAQVFAQAANKASVQRIVYLGGLHPASGELSEHLASRVRVGEILIDSGVPTAALQTGMVIGNGSSSFTMLRHLAERLPVAIAPEWINHHVSPIAVDDVTFYLVRAADLPAHLSRTFDIGTDSSLSYADMMRRYARLTKRIPRFVRAAPVTTPELASHWVALVTPVSRSLANPLIGSLVHDTVVNERDLEAYVGTPEGGNRSFDHAVLRALRGVDTTVWPKVLAATAGATALCATIGSALSKPEGSWYQRQQKPAFQPPNLAFPIAWSSIYADIALVSSLVIADNVEAKRAGTRMRAPGFAAALGTNLLLNASWSGVFFRSHRRGLSTLWSAGLAASSIDLVRRAKQSAPQRGVALAPYAAWTVFATILSGAVAWKNRGRH